MTRCSDFMQQVFAAGCVCLLVMATMAAGQSKDSTKTNCTGPTLSTYLDSQLNLTVGKVLSSFTTGNFSGTVFVPTDKALNDVLAVILDAASNIANKTISALPPGLTVGGLFALPALQDMLKLHVVPAVKVDPTQLTKADIGSDGSLTIPDIPTLLDNQSKKNFCPNTTDASLSAVVKGVSGENLTSVVIVAGGNNATVSNATVGNTCNGVVHIINTVLLPCTANRSVLPSLAANIAAAAVGNTTTANTTSNSTKTGAENAALSSASNTVGTMAAVLATIMLLSGSTTYMVLGALVMVIGSLIALVGI